MESKIKILCISLLFSLNIALTSCNTITGFAKGVVDDIRSIVPGV